ncbi:hypothetical protein [Streptomyces sp. NPDC054961]
MSINGPTSQAGWKRLETLHAGASAWLALTDVDDDGLIGLDEYLRLSQAIGGVPAQRMEEAFRRLDRDGDGGGTWDPAEIDAAVVGFFTSEDPNAPGQLALRPVLIGPEGAGQSFGSWAARA